MEAGGTICGKLADLAEELAEVADTESEDDGGNHCFSLSSSMMKTPRIQS
jgi:hypothetical protein